MRYGKQLFAILRYGITTNLCEALCDNYKFVYLRNGITTNLGAPDRPQVEDKIQKMSNDGKYIFWFYTF